MSKTILEDKLVVNKRSAEVVIPGVQGVKGDKGDTGTTFFPSVALNGNISWTNNGNLPNPATVNIMGPQGPVGATGATGATGVQGPQGVTFTPSVASNGDISWTNDGAMSNPQTVNIRGPRGFVFTPSVASNGDLSWTNNGGLSNPTTVNIKGPQGETGQTGKTGQTGPQGPTGYVFTPSVDSDGYLSWTNNGNLENPETVNIKGPQGETGQTGQTGQQGPVGYVFTPSVASNGDLSWTNNGNLENPETVNIKGPQGETGETGQQGPVGYVYTPSVAANGDLSWTNNGGLSNPTTVNIKGPQGDPGDVGDVKIDGTSIVSSGVAAIPLADSNTFGVIKPGTNVSVTNGVLSATDTTYSAFGGADGTNAGSAGLVPAPVATDDGSFLRGDGTWAAVDALPSQSSQSGKFLTTDGSDASWASIPTYSDFVGSGSSAAAGLVPSPGTTAGSSKYLREDGTWQVPPNDNTDEKASSSNSTSKLFLIGATSQSSSGQTTYSHSSVYATNGAFVASSVQASSDRRLKSDLEELDIDLSELKAYRYTFAPDGKKHIGLIAQDVMSIAPDAVGRNEDTDMLTLDYNAVVALLVSQLNKLHEEVNALRADIDLLKARSLK